MSKMSKTSLSLLTLILGASLLSACGSDNDEPASSPSASSSATASGSPSASPAQSASPSPSAEAVPVDVAKLTADYETIVKMAEEKQDVKAIQQFYRDNFQKNVQARDAAIKEGDPKMDENISFVLEHAASGELNAGQVEEAVDKGLKWYFYLELRNFVNSTAKEALKAGDAEKAAAEFEKATQIYSSVLEPFVEKRDAKFGTTMKDSLGGAVIPQLREDVKAGNLADYDVHRQMLDKTLIKTFTLATWTYAEKMATVEKADQPKAMTEGFFLFLPVYTYLRGGSEADANAVKDAFASGDPAKIDAAKIKASLIATNTGKVKEYLEKSQQELQEGKKDESRVHAMEAAMFLSAQEVFLGADFAAANALGEAYVKAIDDGNAEEAKKQADAIVASLSKL